MPDMLSIFTLKAASGAGASLIAIAVFLMMISLKKSRTSIIVVFLGVQAATILILVIPFGTRFTLETMIIFSVCFLIVYGVWIFIHNKLSAQSELVAQSSSDKTSKGQSNPDFLKAAEIFPALLQTYKALEPFGHQSQQAFCDEILKSKQFNNPELLQEEIISKSLTEKFGINPEIQEFGRELLLQSNFYSARELAELVRILGANVDPSLIIERVKKKHTLEFQKEKIDVLFKVKGEYVALLKDRGVIGCSPEGYKLFKNIYAYREFRQDWEDHYLQTQDQLDFISFHNKVDAKFFLPLDKVKIS